MSYYSYYSNSYSSYYYSQNTVSYNMIFISGGSMLGTSHYTYSYDQNKQIPSYSFIYQFTSGTCTSNGCKEITTYDDCYNTALQLNVPFTDVTLSTSCFTSCEFDEITNSMKYCTLSAGLSDSCNVGDPCTCRCYVNDNVGGAGSYSLLVLFVIFILGMY